MISLMFTNSLSISGDQLKCVPDSVDVFMALISLVMPGTHLEKETKRPIKDCASFLVLGAGNSVRAVILLISGKTVTF